MLRCSTQIAGYSHDNMSTSPGHGLLLGDRHSVAAEPPQHRPLLAGLRGAARADPEPRLESKPQR